MRQFLVPLLLLLALSGSTLADVMTFSDLDPGLPFNQQAPMPVNYSTALPPGVVATWTNFYWKNAAGPNDHTPDNDDQMQVFLPSRPRRSASLEP